MNGDALTSLGRLALEQRLHDLEALIQVVRQINRSLNPENVYQNSLNGIRVALGADFGCFVLLDPVLLLLKLGLQSNLESSLAVDLENLLRDFRFPSDIVYPGDRDYMSSIIGQEIKLVLKDHQITNSFLIPLLTRTQLLGVMAFGTGGEGKFLAPKSIDLVLSIGDQVANAIENAQLHAKLKESEEWSRTFIDDSPDSFWETDWEGNIYYVNDSACKLLGGDRATILKMHRNDFFIIPSERREAIIPLMDKLNMWAEPHAHLRTLDGQIKDISITIRFVRDATGTITRFQSVFRDVTEQTQTYETLQQRNEELRVLNSIASILANPTQIDHALDQVCQEIITITGMETIGIYVLDAIDSHLNLLAQRGMSDNLIAQAQTLGLDDPATRRVAAQGEAYALDDFLNYGSSPDSFLGPKSEGYRSGIAVPLERRGGPIGALFIGSKSKTQFEPSDLELMKNIGRQIGIAIDNADLFAEMDRRARELAGLAELSAACASTLDPIAIGHITIEGIRKLLPVSICNLRVREGANYSLLASYTVMNGALPASPKLEELVRATFERKNLVTVANVDTEPQLELLRADLKKLNACAIAMMPLLIQERIIGALIVAFPEPHIWLPREIELLKTIANQVAVALDNARQYVEMRQRLQELDGLYKLSIACSSTMNPQDLSQIAADYTHQLAPDADFAIIRLLDQDQLHLTASYLPKDIHLSETIPVDDYFGKIIYQSEKVLISNVYSDLVPEPHRSGFIGVGIQSIAIVPMLARDHAIGGIALAYLTPHTWQPHEVDLLQTIANQIANAVDNARLFQNVESERQKVQAIFDSGLSGMFVTDVGGHIIMFNHMAEKMSGWSLKDVYNKTWDEVLRDPNLPSASKSLIDEALINKKIVFAQVGRRIRTRGGKVIPCAKAVAPLLDADGNVTGAVGAFWDLSHEERAEIERTRFLHLVAHQLRTPLTALLSASQLLREKGKLSAQREAEMWDIVKDQGERLHRFASQFLSLEAMIKSERPIELKPIPIGTLIHELMNKYIVDADHQYKVWVSEPGPLVQADAERLENVLCNLIDNAKLYSPKQTLITVSVQEINLEHVLIQVEDQGSGIPENEQEKIFQPFYRSPRELGTHTHGHGLGLAIAQRMVKEMGSEITVLSEEGQGATFRFTLRRAI
ncbi:MAG: GAF domain-containing protein [Chloroflexi bacterium]|nr:GAF domain-containing protein [Chloroflexota bacterium]